jgi:hypothetical protein
MEGDEIRMAIFDRRTGLPVKISRPVPDVKKLFTLPPSDTRLWKYGDYRKFAQLFSEQTLYFRRADQLPDLYEGKFTAANQERRSDMFAGAFADLGLGDPAAIHAIQESHRTRTFLHCWHKNARENPRMWKEYTTSADSIVVVTTVAALFAATPAHCKGAEVHYVGEDDPLPELHSLAALVHKRRDPYAFEDEFRLMYMLPPGESVLLDQKEDFFRLIPADTGTLVHEVRFHPAASPEFKNKVRAEIAAGNWKISVRDSEFAAC